MIILWIVADSMRCDYLEPDIIGMRLNSMAAIAADGVVFERAYAQSSFTTFSFGSFITGRYPWNIYTHDVFDGTDSWTDNAVPLFSEDIRTVFSVAEEAGFDCVSFTQPVLGHAYSYSSWGRDLRWNQKSGTPRVPYIEPVLEHLRNGHTKHDDLLLFIRCSDTHIPWIARDAMHIDGLEGTSWDSVTRFVSKLLQGEHVEMVKGYIRKGLVRFDSHFLRPLYEELKALDEYDDALIVVHADHGDLLWDRSDICKDEPVGHIPYVWECVVRVPLIIKFPKHLRMKGVRRALFELRDLFVVVSSVMTAYSRSDHKTTELDSALFWNWLFPKRKYAYGTSLGSLRYVTDGRIKLIYNVATQQTMLFDLSKDSCERNDLARSVPDTVQAMLSCLAAQIGFWPPPPVSKSRLGAVMRMLGYLE